MARSPSARALSNVVDLYRFTGTQDADGGVAPNPYGSALATAVPCSVQPDNPIRFFDEAIGRIVEKTPYNVFFATDYALKADDKIVWVDDTGATRNLFVFGTANEAGKGGTFTVHAEERT
jgi:hypothetical protein